MRRAQFLGYELILFSIVLFVCCCTCLGGFVSQRRETNVRKGLTIPHYTAKRTIDSIVVDGKATEQSWKAAKRVGRFVTWDGKQHPDITDCKIVWDEKGLYILFVCRDADIQASLRRHDDPLWEEDVVEVFIDADGDEKTYIELVVNPLNTTFDNYLLRNPRENKRAAIHCWTCPGLTTSVTVEGSVRKPQDTGRIDGDKQWIVEMRIPFSSFVLTAGPSGKPPQDGDVWRMALTRYDRPEAKTLLHLAWSPPYARGWPHVTQRFGRVVFSSKGVSE